MHFHGSNAIVVPVMVAQACFYFESIFPGRQIPEGYLILSLCIGPCVS